MTMPSADIIKDFVISAHFNLPKVQTYLTEYPDLLRAEHQWAENDFEDGLGAASHVGNRAIAQYFIEQGVEPTICAVAMLGDRAGVDAFLALDPQSANARGAHGISLMFHVALSGDVAIAQTLKDAGCHEGFNHALHGALMFGHVDMVRWLLANGVTDVNTFNYENKTPLVVAIEKGYTDIEALLREAGA